MDRHLLKTISDRVWQASHPQVETRDSLTENALPESSRAWLQAAASQFAVDQPRQEEFARTGVIKLTALHLVTICQSEVPVPLWLVAGWLQKPQALHPESWQEALLRVNDVAMAMSGIAISVDEHGNTLLLKRLAFDAVGDADALAEVMNDVDSLAASLVDLLLSLGQISPEPEEPVPPLPEWIAGWQQQTARQSDALAQQALQTEWHHPLLQQTIGLLGLPTTRYIEDGCFGLLHFPERSIEIIACADQRHLSLSTPLNLTLSAKELLSVNSELQVLTNCAFALSGEKICLVCRWDTTGLDAEAFAGWLADFMTLCVAFDRRELTKEENHE
ncbi:type III secretion system chaperone [Pantoea sp. BAV 3049]|uniref:type III secretion system chaperone n=1 Tax=Pantoea sp. BAV 3049 TaxID=2654188 RepID=UPI00131C80B6|nr:type III secretion system chaperone [Pantoea sp. BAV 3049]